MALVQRTLTATWFLLAIGIVTTVNAAELDWQPYAKLLSVHVSVVADDAGEQALVDYGAIADDPHFDLAIERVEKFDVVALSTREEKLAFYLNAYNLFAIKMVVDHWPLESIKDVGNLFSPVWKKTAGTLAGRSVSLDYIEHKILRPTGEPRIHIGLVCASMGCPNLRTEPYRAAVVHEQLDQQARQFLSNPVKGLRIDDGHIRVSKIFKWFEEDFAMVGGVRRFVELYRPDLPPSAAIKANLPYDWSVNVK